MRPEKEMRQQKGQCDSVTQLLVVKREERPMSQGLQWPPRAGKPKEPDPSLEAQKDMVPV